LKSNLQSSDELISCVCKFIEYFGSGFVGLYYTPATHYLQTCVSVYFFMDVLLLCCCRLRYSRLL